VGQRTVVVEADSQEAAIERLRELGYYDQNATPDSVRRINTTEDIAQPGNGFR
jgi:hypothetical protein